MLKKVDRNSSFLSNKLNNAGQQLAFVLRYPKVPKFQETFPRLTQPEWKLMCLTNI